MTTAGSSGLVNESASFFADQEMAQQGPPFWKAVFVGAVYIVINIGLMYIRIVIGIGGCFLGCFFLALLNRICLLFVKVFLGLSEGNEDVIRRYRVDVVLRLCVCGLRSMFRSWKVFGFEHGYGSKIPGTVPTRPINQEKVDSATCGS